MGRRQLWKREGFRSGFEKRIKDKLEVSLGTRFGYEDRRYSYVSEHKYTPDFSIYSSTGELIFAIEAKGRFLTSDRSKLLAVRKANPELDLRLLFQKDQIIRKGSTTLYSDWARKHNFKYHVGEDIPEEWLF